MAFEERIEIIRRTFALIKRVKGTVVECGVKRGWSLAVLAQCCQEEGRGRHVYGFDAWDSAMPYGPHDQRCVGTLPYEEALPVIQAKLANRGVPDGATTLVRGLIAETAPETQTGPVAYLHVDVDIYRSYLDSLGAFWPRMPVGGVALLDEYHEHKVWPGAKRAVDEFLATVPHELHEGTRWYAVKR